MSAVLRAEKPKFGLPWFDEVEPILLADPLAELLGVLPPGEPMAFTYADCVRLAGHSCLAVAGAYGLAARALPRLFAPGLPVRGEVEVVALGGPEELAFGPMAMILGAIAGAEGEAGFGGLKGRYRRRGLIRFESHRFEPNTFELRRLDGRGSITCTFNPRTLCSPGPSAGVLARLLDGEGTEEEQRDFAARWQGMVREALLDPPEGLFVLR